MVILMNRMSIQPVHTRERRVQHQLPTFVARPRLIMFRGELSASLSTKSPARFHRCTNLTALTLYTIVC
jgi:hypothetical protein